MLRRSWPRILAGALLALVLFLVAFMRGAGRERALVSALLAPDSDRMLAVAARVRELAADDRESVRRQVARRMLTDRDADLRLRASFALVQLAHPDNVRSFRRALSDLDERVRASAATALGNLQARGAADEVLELLADRSETVRRSAAYALGMMGAAQALESLARMAGDPDEMSTVRDTARRAVDRIRGVQRPARPEEELWRPPDS